MATLRKMRRDAERWSRGLRKRAHKHRDARGETWRVDHYDEWLKAKGAGRGR